MSDIVEIVLPEVPQIVEVIDILADPYNVLFFADFASFPVTPSLKKIYVAKDTNLIYRYESGWLLLGSVISVNGKTRAVVLNQNDIRRVTTIATSATPTPNCDTTDEYEITALASAAVFGAPTGTPVDGQKLLYRYKDNGTSRALSLNAVFVDLVDVPTSTTVGKVGMFGARWAASRSKWEIVATVTEP